MYKLQYNGEDSGNNGGDIQCDSNASDTVHITVNSGNESSTNGPTTNQSNVDLPGIKYVVKQPAINTVQSIFQRPSIGYGTSHKPPQFDNDPFKFHFFLNRLHHYLLMLGIYYAINDPNIAERTDMDLYLAIASCLTELALDLV